MKVHILGIDLAKNVFQLHGVDRKERAVLVRRVRREHLLKILGELKPCIIGFEASTGAFFWQRQFEKLGHVVKIMAPQYVKPSYGDRRTTAMTPRRSVLRSSNGTCDSCQRRRWRSRISRPSIARGNGWSIIAPH